jgi:hypothetical protein
MNAEFVGSISNKEVRERLTGNTEKKRRGSRC